MVSCIVGGGYEINFKIDLVPPTTILLSKRIIILTAINLREKSVRAV